MMTAPNPRVSLSDCNNNITATHLTLIFNKPVAKVQSKVLAANPQESNPINGKGNLVSGLSLKSHGSPVECQEEDLIPNLSKCIRLSLSPLLISSSSTKRVPIPVMSRVVSKYKTCQK